MYAEISGTRYLKKIIEPVERRQYHAKRIKEQRVYLGLTQKQVAARIGIPYQDYQKYEYGLIEPKRDQYERICDALKLDYESKIHSKYRF